MIKKSTFQSANKVSIKHDNDHIVEAIAVKLVVIYSISFAKSP